MNSYIPKVAKIIDLIKHTEKDGHLELSAILKMFFQENSLRYQCQNTEKVQFQ